MIHNLNHNPRISKNPEKFQKSETKRSEAGRAEAEQEALPASLRVIKGTSLAHRHVCETAVAVYGAVSRYTYRDGQRKSWPAEWKKTEYTLITKS